MVRGWNARFLRGCRTGFCPHSKTAAAWTAISINAPLWLKLWGSTVRDGSVFITREAAKCCRSGEFRTWEFWMNLVIASVCWKHIFKRNKTSMTLPTKLKRTISCFPCCVAPALKTFPVCSDQDITIFGAKEQKALPPMIPISFILINEACLLQASKVKYLTCCLGWRLESLTPYRAVTSLKIAKSRWTDCTAGELLDA